MGFKSKKERGEVDPIFLALKEKRVALGVSQPELGRLINVDDNTIWAWESGTAVPRWENLRAWIYALGFDLKLVKDKTDV